MCLKARTVKSIKICMRLSEIVSEGKRRIGINDEYLNIICNYF